LSALVASVLGYFLFFGRISGVFLGIVTLAVTLVLERFMAQTAGPEWHIGSARLNGFNGMNGMPNLTIPWSGENGPLVLAPDLPLYYVVLALLVLVYLALRILVNSSFGNVLVAIRENPARATMLGYDMRKYQLAAFVIGSSLAGLSGVLYTSWGQYITPSSNGHHGGCIADCVGRGRRAQRSDSNAAGHDPPDWRLSGADCLRESVCARCDGRAARGNRAACAGGSHHGAGVPAATAVPASRP
jgi:hypothetical protein